MKLFITASFRKAVIVKYLLASMLVLLVACHTHKHPVKPKKPVNTLIKDKNSKNNNANNNNNNNNNNANNNNDNNTSGSKFYAKYSKKWGVKLDGNENKKIIESIDSWLGTPYKYGGMSKSGTDCSGFTKSVYKEACNIDLNRSAADQVKDVTLVDKDKLHFGDLIFFKISGNKVSHVGLYINDSKFVHASTKNGVTISNLDDAYYKKYFYKGGKINKKT